MRVEKIGIAIRHRGDPTVLSEPSGGKALVFDQGERLTQTISCADVADVCVKSLHDSEARNRTFDVAYDKGATGLGHKLA